MSIPVRCRPIKNQRDGGHPAAATQIRNVLKRMYDYAVELNLAESNPGSAVATKFIGKATRRTRNLTPKEIRHYLQTIYVSNMRRQFKLALHVILLTLIRKSEIIMESTVLSSDICGTTDEVHVN